MLALTLLLSTVAHAQTPDLCGPLLAERVRIDTALAAIAAGANPNARCERTITVHVGHRFSLPEVILGIIIPPVGALMLLGADGHEETRLQHPAPLDLAIAARAPDLTDALLAAGADPLLPAPAGEGVPLESAIAQDMALGGTSWSARLLAHAHRVPPDLLEGKPAALDDVLNEPALLATLLERGLDPEGRDTAGMTWLTRAIRDDDMDQLRAALAAGADPNLRLRGLTPIGRAVGDGSLEALQILVEGGGRPLEAAGSGGSLLTRAVESDSPAMVAAVIAAGVPLDGSDGQGQAPLEAAVKGASPQIVHALLAAGAEAQAGEAYYATERGDPDLLRAVLAAGASPNHHETFGRRPLHVAISDGRVDLVQILLEAGASPAMPDATIFNAGAPIDQVFQAEDTEMLVILLPHVAASARTTLLIQALREERWAHAALIANADTDLSEALGRLLFPDQAPARAWLRERGARFPADALTEAVHWGDLATVQQALADGARVDIPAAYSDELPADAAILRADWPITAVLIEHGARVSAHYRLSTPIRDRDPMRVRMALDLGASVRQSDIREAATVGDVASLHAMASRDTSLSPRAWAPDTVGYRSSADVDTALTEIHARKVAEAKAARAARRDAKREARRAKWRARFGRARD